jgi:thiosulfate/3-mercaptopyruvate sulfurtransferase
MKLWGHADVRILDASREAWRAAGHPWSNTTSQPACVEYPFGEPDGYIRVDQAAVRAAIDQTGTLLVDVRSEAEYRGERFWPSGGSDPNGRAGHVPSAVHQPIDGLYDHHGAFRTADDLSNLFSSLDLDGDGELITYCTIGGRAATAWFVLPARTRPRSGLRRVVGRTGPHGRHPRRNVMSCPTTSETPSVFRSDHHYHQPKPQRR